MRKILTLVISLIMLLSAVTTINVAAVNNAPEKDYLFLDDFDKAQGVYSYPDNVSYYYDEVYYHHVDENDPNSEIDWAFIYALGYATNNTSIKTIIADRIVTTAHDVWYQFGWALYDAETKEFIPLHLIDETKYEGLPEGLEQANIGTPLGDANLDGELTILDATYIQRVMARVCEFDSRDDLRIHYEINVDGKLDYISDMDRDGETTIFDATAIQMKLAKIETE